MVARKAGTIAGLPLVEAAFRKLDPHAEIVPHARDGATVTAKTKLMTITGNARAVLAAERTALNFIGHLSGIATATAELVAKTAGTKARITDTRKTTPGLRALQKYAVRCGGGFNHRFGLDDAILIKDNHIAVAGGIRPALEGAKAVAGHLVKIEIEVDTLDQLREVLDCGLADVVLLDNMSIADMTKAVDMVAGRLVIEASGSITLDKVAEIAATGSITCRPARSRIPRPISISRSISRCDISGRCGAVPMQRPLPISLSAAVLAALLSTSAQADCTCRAQGRDIRARSGCMPCHAELARASPPAAWCSTTRRGSSRSRPASILSHCRTGDPQSRTTVTPKTNPELNYIRAAAALGARGCRRAPGRRFRTVAPGARPVEGVDAEPIELLHFVDPARAAPNRRGNASTCRFPAARFCRRAYRARCAWRLPMLRLGDDIADIVAGEGELAGQMPVRVLVDHAADVVRVVAGEGAIEHDLRHRHLSALGLAARLEIDRVGQAALVLDA